MSRVSTYEQGILCKAFSVLASFSQNFQDQMLVIEYCSSLYGGFNIREYWELLKINVQLDFDDIEHSAKRLKEEISKTKIPHAVALSSLARKPIPISEQKKEGAFYTDYRLAAHVAGECRDYLSIDTTVADIAAGTGILLAGVAHVYIDLYPNHFDDWIANNVYAFDLSEDALRGCLASIASCSSSISAILSLKGHFRVTDSLTTDFFNDTHFDLIVGNPPWGKIKLTRHSFSLEQGAEHVYGTDYNEIDEQVFLDEKERLKRYVAELKEKYSLLGSSDPDFYVAFIEKALNLLKPSGRLVYIVPAGVIRSQGTQPLRERLFYHCSDIEVLLFNNKERYFSIDSRFKFLIIGLNNKENDNPEILLNNHTESKGSRKNAIRIKLDILSKYRKDLTIPEVRSKKELDLFLKICQHGQIAPEWDVDICREIDMTNDKRLFLKKSQDGSIPVIEGRMVQPFRLGVKKYISGSGRQALWIPCKEGVFPQFFIKINDLPDVIKTRISRSRIGYCDIAGQTNERSMMATVIPESIICGNKVPTLLFNGERKEDYQYFWLGIVNSIVYDWMLRRVLTTTVNYFLLWSLPFPTIDIDSEIAQKIIVLSKELSEMGPEYYLEDKSGKLRAEIDVLVAKAYDLKYDDLVLILEDFPLLDRGQPNIKGKKTITKALILAAAEELFEEKDNSNRLLSNKLFRLGARPYILSEMKTLL